MGKSKLEISMVIQAICESGTNSLRILYNHTILCKGKSETLLYIIIKRNSLYHSVILAFGQEPSSSYWHLLMCASVRDTIVTIEL